MKMLFKILGIFLAIFLIYSYFFKTGVNTEKVVIQAVDINPDSLEVKDLSLLISSVFEFRDSGSPQECYRATEAHIGGYDVLPDWLKPYVDKAQDFTGLACRGFSYNDAKIKAFMGYDEQSIPKIFSSEISTRDTLNRKIVVVNLDSFLLPRCQIISFEGYIEPYALGVYEVHQDTAISQIKDATRSLVNAETKSNFSVKIFAYKTLYAIYKASLSGLPSLKNGFELELNVPGISQEEIDMILTLPDWKESPIIPVGDLILPGEEEEGGDYE